MLRTLPSPVLSSLIRTHQAWPNFVAGTNPDPAFCNNASKVTYKLTTFEFSTLFSRSERRKAVRFVCFLQLFFYRKYCSNREIRKIFKIPMGKLFPPANRTDFIGIWRYFCIFFFDGFMERSTYLFYYYGVYTRYLYLVFYPPADG